MLTDRQEMLWCLPYDTDSVFKPFLKIPFSTFLNNIISNQYFPAYQQVMAKQLVDQDAWNQKCWQLIQFFQFLNNRFEVDTWDQNITFIQENQLRNTMGYFRLWIDTERLYLLNFLKLDSNQFQEDRIYMSLYRTLTILKFLFTEYGFRDFTLSFLNKFIHDAIMLLQDMMAVSTNETSTVLKAIITLLKNIKQRQKELIDPDVLNSLKKNAQIKISKQSQAIRNVELRLKNSSTFKRKIDEELRLKKICRPGFIDELTNSIKGIYDPIHKISTQYEVQFYGTPEQKEKKRSQGIKQKVQIYKTGVISPHKIEMNLYDTINQNKQNPYSLQNYQIYGEYVKVNMDDRLAYDKQKKTEVVSVEDSDRSKFYYDQRFIEQVESADNNMGKITLRDINMTNKKTAKKSQNFKGEDENNKVFNLKWHHPQSKKKQSSDNVPYIKDYDNNLLFKSPLEEQVLQSKRNNLDKLRDSMGVKSYTVALYEQLGNQLHPQNMTSSYGATFFVNKKPQLLDMQKFTLVNQNKFDFMRKVVGYMTAQKKIRNLILQKNVPEIYPRNYSDVKQEIYDPSLYYQKYKYALGQTYQRPAVCL